MRRTRADDLETFKVILKVIRPSCQMYPFDHGHPLPWSRLLIAILAVNVCHGVWWRKGHYEACGRVISTILFVLTILSLVFVVLWFLMPDWIPRANLDSSVYPEISSIHLFCVSLTGICEAVFLVLFRYLFHDLADALNDLVVLWTR